MPRDILLGPKRKPGQDIQTSKSRFSDSNGNNLLPSVKYPGRKGRNNPGYFGCINIYLFVGGSDMTVAEFMEAQAQSWYNHFKNKESFKTTLPSW